MYAPKGCIWGNHVWRFFPSLFSLPAELQFSPSPGSMKTPTELLLDNHWVRVPCRYTSWGDWSTLPHRGILTCPPSRCPHPGTQPDGADSVWSVVGHGDGGKERACRTARRLAELPAGSDSRYAHSCFIIHSESRGHTYLHGGRCHPTGWTTRTTG